ncbi:MAG: tRNA uridine-5-carboxymethylaminomethyl(34) synthesis GTPase MnmE [Heliobacteriaceae bacterium]|nr:tRNA uridine-5-carboxymethylaminomethyl(34) synthesis GTPase MnmE [Heliobacteriaceae bacterium]MDD4587683.1 tRNA uridine-5-carboxymethylaminomethyl(34) synthesis GTPase MnmE [Heliobacteriaceae bacterium]
MVGDTIAAIATPIGDGGIGIVRLSGPDVKAVVNKMFRPRYKGNIEEWSTHTLHLGLVIHPDNGRVIDEVLLAWMQGPRTYTTEDVAEFHCHGGSVPLRETFEAVLRAGTRPAMPGEFAKRAFLGGRLDLAQAEAIIDVVQAKTSEGLGVAVAQLAGGLSQRVGKISQMLLGVIAHLEAVIDFPEEDLPPVIEESLKKTLEETVGDLKSLIRTARTGRVLREGWRTVIIGRPNVGKSSLLNTLLDEQRAIVTELPGTTRDAIEEMIDLGGIPLKLVDTAGIRETDDVIERIGVEKSLAYVEKADLVLLMLDGSELLTSDDLRLLELLGNRPAIVLINKIDLPQQRLDREQLGEYVAGQPVIPVSVKENKGLEALTGAIRQLVFGGDNGQVKANAGLDLVASRQEMVTRVRHKEALERALAYIESGLTGLSAGAEADFLTIDLRGAWEALGEITGETVDGAVLDRIFAEFCIGK